MSRQPWRGRLRRVRTSCGSEEEAECSHPEVKMMPSGKDATPEGRSRKTRPPVPDVPLPQEDDPMMTINAAEGREASPVVGLPQEIWVQILSWLPGKDVLQHAALVSRRWYHMSRDELLWHMLCMRSGRCQLATIKEEEEESRGDDQARASSRPESWFHFYWLPQNLLVPYEHGSPHWRMKRGGDGWKKFDLDPETAQRLAVQHFLASSYEWCTKTQVVDLVAKGLSEAYLDTSPAIRVSEWFSARTDCGSRYEFTVKLLGEDKRVLESWSTAKQAETHWVEEQHVFRGYPKGVRYIKFKNRGKDNNWWAGHYGARMAAPSVSILVE